MAVLGDIHRAQAGLFVVVVGSAMTSFVVQQFEDILPHHIKGGTVSALRGMRNEWTVFANPLPLSLRTHEVGVAISNESERDCFARNDLIYTASLGSKHFRI